MKKHTLPLFCCIVSLLLAGACRTVKIEGPAAPVVHPKPALQQAKKSLAPQKLSAKDIPPVLGGIIQSDNWTIYKDEQQEEFSGHVSYDNGAYVFKSDYALSDRAKSTFSARGNVFLRQNNPDGSFYEARGDQGSYNYHTQKGSLVSRSKTPVKLVYRNEKGQVITATAKTARFDIGQKIYILESDVHIERLTEQGKQQLSAQKATFKQLETYALLEGNAKITDGQRTLSADTIIYDGQHDVSYAYGARPLVEGVSEQGTFAVIADQFQSDAQGNIVHLDGKVQGWLVSPQINDTKLNAKF